MEDEVGPTGRAVSSEKPVFRLLCNSFAKFLRPNHESFPSRPNDSSHR